VCIAVTGRELDKAQAVPVQVQAHGFTIDRDGVGKTNGVGQVAMVQVNRHIEPLLNSD
jgi:hypothetical protein